MALGRILLRFPVYELVLLLLFLKCETCARTLDVGENTIDRQSSKKDLQADSVAEELTKHTVTEDQVVEREVEPVKDYTGWQMLRIFPSSTSVLDQVLTLFEADPRVVVLGVFRSQLAVDVAMSPTTSLDAVLSHAHLPNLCNLDSKKSQLLKEPISTTKILRLCSDKRSTEDETSLGNAQENQNSNNLIGWKTVDGYLSPKSSRQINETQPLAWDDYYRYDSIVMFVQKLATEYHTVEYLEIGKSCEGRPLLALVFAVRPAQMVKQYQKSIFKNRRLRNRAPQNTFSEKQRHKKKTNSKKKNTKTFVFIEAGIHAREWISSAVATYLTQQLADSGRNFLRRVTVVVAPMANPDGYEYSHTTDRMWRKNRREIPDSECMGVDLNRNWAKAWGSSGSSSDPCSNTFRGSEAFSEPETKALRDLAFTWIDKISLFLSFHSYGNFILHPWSYSVSPSSKERVLKKVAKRMRNHMKRNGYPKFTGGQTGDVLYQASGTSEDYIHNAGVTYAYTIELPHYSFILDPENILPVAKAVWGTLVCTIGIIAKKESVQAFCKKRLVKVHLEDGKTLSGWFDKKLPLEKAKQSIMERHNITEETVFERRYAKELVFV
ncbi:carboxypeptidase A2-like [Penaeus chinensis]|uniref:carboxypeptidase A2-like n=1 Tax=Penaeus chinensis TaxID=139456 RepID=UPI001FB6BFEE|nr:carboxypeptidase A2-like [Penaeus chinensis]